MFKEEDNRLKSNDKKAKRLHKMKLSVGDIKTDPETFQFRDFETTESHVDDLGKALKAGRKLPPILVWNSGDGDYIVIDGHHRLEAHCRYKPNDKIAVEIFTGTKAEARLLACEENAKARLPMTHQERSNAAWRLVCSDGGYSKAETCRVTGISDSTVSKMRRTKTALTEKEQELPRTWLQALQAVKGYEQEAMTDDTWNEITKEKANELYDRVGGEIARMAKRYPKAVYLMLEKAMGDRGLDELVEWHGPPEGGWEGLEDYPF